MKRLSPAYGFTLCFLTAGLVWVYLDVQIPRRKQSHFRAFVIQDSLPVATNTSGRSTFAPSGNQHFYNILNNSHASNIHQSSGSSISQSSASSIRQSYDSSIRQSSDSSIRQSSVSYIEGSAQNATVYHTTTSATYDPPTTEVAANQISSAHIVAIVSYMRSGSTFTADILQHYPGTVYVFEPFHMLMLRVRQKRQLIYLNGTKRLLQQEDLTDAFLANELHKWMNCRYMDLDAYSLADNFHTHFSRSMKKLVDCWRPKRHTLKSMRECLPAAIQMCKNAKHRLFKFIRLRMRIIERVMNAYPNLQIIHLIRDPRGSITSQVKVLKKKWSSADTLSSDRCSLLADDLKYTLPMIDTYPERVKILIYENLARKPLNVARQMLTFLRYKPYKYVMRYISKVTSEGRRDGPLYGVIRGNSTKTAFSWRQKVDFADVNVIDNNCRHIYSALGFRTLSSPDDIIDESVPTHVSPDSPGII